MSEAPLDPIRAARAHMRQAVVKRFYRTVEVREVNPPTGVLEAMTRQMSAERIGINVTDLNCLNIVALTGSMTAGDLARATGLTTASITGVLDRLEEGGFVRRERDPHDRRRVIVKLNAGPGLREIGPTFGPLLKAWRATAAGYSDDDLRLLLEFQQRFEEIVREQLERLRGGAGN